MTNEPPTPKQIERRAYEIYLERGAEHGRDVEDWLVAERELTQAADRETNRPVMARAASASGSAAPAAARETVRQAPAKR